MANIKVNDIKPAGVELFADSESFMSDMSNDELAAIYGGAQPTIVTNSGSCGDSACCQKKK